MIRKRTLAAALLLGFAARPLWLVAEDGPVYFTVGGREWTAPANHPDRPTRDEFLPAAVQIRDSSNRVQPLWQPADLLEGQNSRQWDEPTPYSTAVRGGWWTVDSDGSPVKTGEFQDLESSPFWDADGLWTNGRRTLDFYVTGLDDEGNQAGLRYYGRNVAAKVRYNRYLRRLDHDPLDNIHDVTSQTPGGDLVVREDLDAGRDYAYRIQQFEAAFKGNISEELKWRLKVWGLRKKGERQVSALAHGFSIPNGMDVNGNAIPQQSCQACHLQSQGQQVDWLTTEIEPALEATIGPHIVEYSRTMRTFSQNDELVTRPYNRFGFNGDLPYAAVPENYTEIDRVKLNTALSSGWDFYANAYTGNTLNRTRQTNRRLWGYDLRTTLSRSERSTLTGYAKKNVQTGQLPPFLVPPETASSIRAPLNYDLVTAGMKGNWRPFLGESTWRRNVRVSGGYEYRSLARENALFAEGGMTYNESQTTAHWIHSRVSTRFGPALQSFVGYKLGFVDNPLYAIAKNGTTNTSLPTQVHEVDVGGTWTPNDAFLVSATFGLQNRWNDSDVATFTQDDYPMTVTAWWGPTSRWSVTGGLGFYSSWIDQDITLGALSDPVTNEWNYSNRSHLINVGSTYRWTDRTTFSGGFEFVRGRNSFESLAMWPDLPLYSDVLVDITRWTAGVDHQLRPGIDAYFRYQFFEYEDKAGGPDSGRANMLLGGISAIY